LTVGEKKLWVDNKQKGLSVTAQCKLLRIPRSSYYYRRVPISKFELGLMRRIDEIYTAWPFYGSRKIAQELKKEGCDINRKHVQRIMRLLGLASNQPGPNTSKPHPEHIKFPYLLKNLSLSSPLEVWSTDITYIRLPNGFVYLVAVIDPHSPFSPSLQQLGDGLLFGCFRRSCQMPWPAQNLQYRPGSSIYLSRVCQRRAREKHSLQHGWTRQSSRQCVRGAAMEVCEV
jgi:hypothetical protein